MYHIIGDLFNMNMPPLNPKRMKQTYVLQSSPHSHFFEVPLIVAVVLE